MLKDKAVSWFLQNMIIPKHEVIDNPGFILSNITKANGEKTYLRDILIPESFFEKLEINVVNKYGNVGKEVLYSIGKKYGYLYASLQNFPVKTKSSKKTIINFAYIFARYLEGTDASYVKYDINVDTNIFKVWLKDYIICRHDGLGLIMTAGATGGIWAWVCGDIHLESIQTACQGSGAALCEVICAPVQELNKLSKNIYVENDVLTYVFDNEYETRNKLRSAKYSKNSLKTLLDNNFISYKNSIFSYHDKRLLMNESHILFLVEAEMKKLDKGNDILFECSFNEGKEIASVYGNEDWDKFIMDFFPALGFGDITILNQRNPTVGLIYYPWTKLFKESDYTIIRGILSGVISHCTGKETKLSLKNVEVGEYTNIVLVANGT